MRLSSLRIIFAGTNDFAARHLATLINTNNQVIGVFTQPDRPAGRGNHLTESAVKKLTKYYNLPVFQPTSLRTSESQQIIAALRADIMVVVAYGLLLPKEVLELPRLGCINVHCSLLPRWRGAAPIQRALLAGDQKTGISIIQMDTGLDTGALLYQTTCEIRMDDTSATLSDRLAQTGSTALLTTLLKLSSNNRAATVPQDDEFATYAAKISKTEARLNWQLPAVQLERCIRAFNPWPVSYFQVNQLRLKVFRASVRSSIMELEQHVMPVPGTVLAIDKSGIYIATGDGILQLTLLQQAGKKIMPIQEFINARRLWLRPGTILE